MLDFTNKNHKWILIQILVWGIGKLLFLSIKLWGFQENQMQHVNINLGVLLAVVTFSGFVDGLFFGLIDTALDNRFQHFSLFKRLAIKCVCNLAIGLLFTFSLIPTIIGHSSGEASNIVIANLVPSNVLMITIYIFIITFLLQLFKLVFQWVLVNNFSELISLQQNGAEEDRIFIFLDMKSSTTIAEKLGPEKYSLFIKDCFNDMIKSSEITGGEIYQYVGDEAIFSWLAKDENFRHAVYHFFSFRKNIQSRSAYYMKQYGVVPQFKAAIHHGKVIRTQVGTTKRSIAFHGDVVNTCSRIQGLCNQLNCDLLISEPVANRLSELYHIKNEGQFELRGKDLGVNLFSVNAN
ncbi:MAG: adenylate/guanylate cyclase domain-containing protein [Allomuricauda sp.]